MRWNVFIFLAVFFPVCAEALPNTHSLLEKQSDSVEMKELRDPVKKRSTYRIEICPTNKCDSFESTSSAMLDDYVYLYSVYVAGYVDFSAPLPDGRYRPLPFISEAVDKGYAKEILDSYAARLKCVNSSDIKACVLSALRKSAAIKHFAVTYDEGERIQTLITDEGKY